MINEEMIKGKWNEIKGDIKAQWGKLTDNELDQASGNLTSVAGLIQQRYGLKKEEAQEKLHQIAVKFVKKTDEFKKDIKKAVK